MFLLCKVREQKRERERGAPAAAARATGTINADQPVAGNDELTPTHPSPRLAGLILTLPYARLAESVNKHTFLFVGFVTSTASMAYFFLICESFTNPPLSPLCDSRLSWSEYPANHLPIRFLVKGHFSGPSVPLHLVVLSRVFESVGGGISMAYILLYSLLALAVPAETRCVKDSLFLFSPPGGSSVEEEESGGAEPASSATSTLLRT